MRQFDGERVTLAEKPFPAAFETLYPIRVRTQGDRIVARVGEIEIEARDARALAHGGVALIAAEGACSCGEIQIGPGT